MAVADYINEKQGGTPREAVKTIVGLINSKDSYTPVFALALLDVLVKNCGYPLHLQISRKEFLNELVKRFPERPPTRYTKVQRLILGAIEEWNQTICKTSKYKSDLGFIRDMHRLLTYKGYTFPEVKAEDASVLNPSDNLKSIAEIQKEEQIAQAAKLQELVRRGRPSDLKEANKLMKVMAGFKDDNQVESRAQVASDLDRLRRKADIFSEMLANAESTGSLDPSDETLVELFSSLKVAQPKIQKIIEEEQDDEEAVQDLLKLNDIVNSLVQKYEFLKAGDINSASQVKVSSNQQSLSLIDFDDEPSASPAPQQNNSNVDDLLGDLTSLSFNSTPQNYGNGGAINLGSVSPQPANAQPNYDVFSQLSNLTSTSAPAPAPIVQSQPANANTFDLLGDVFSTPSQSQQPAQSLPRITVNESQHLKFDIAIINKQQNSIQAKAIFSNNQAISISNLKLLIAVPKSLSLSLEPQSSTFIPSFGKDSVTQVFTLNGVVPGVPPKIKWKIDYSVNGGNVEETNTFTFP